MKIDVKIMLLRVPKTLFVILPASIFLSQLSASFASTPRNILLIIADDYGADSSSLYNSTNTGASLPPTPNVISLAQSGVVFRNAYAYPVCSPTRSCLITGRFGFRTGMGDVVAGAGSAVLNAGEFTLPEAFAANAGLGYQLAQFGKWHLNNGATSPNNIGGWPHFAGSLIGALASYTNWSKTIDGSTSTSTNYATTDIINDTIAWIQSQGTKPWFAWVAFNAPHTPLNKPPNSLCPHYTSLSGTQADINAHPRPYFEAMVESMDTEMGRLLAAVDRANTHIIFMGDNRTLGNVIQPPFPATRGKDTLYEGGTRVPFIIAGPAVANPGRTNDTLVNVVDVFATVLELAGINVAATVPANIALDSQSLLPVLQTNTTLARYGYAELFGPNVSAAIGGRALRNTQFKLIEFNDNHREFYDLASDPYESTNLLNNPLDAVQQANYYGLTLGLNAYQTNVARTVITGYTRTNTQFSVKVARDTNLNYTLWRNSGLADLDWAPLTNAVYTTNVSTLTLTDTNANLNSGFYLVIPSAP
jgi:arylsulfatase A-like enzyme